MRQPARIFETIQILHRIDGAPVPMDRVCGDYFRTRRAIGSKDRADIAERVYRVMRAHARLRWWADRIGLDPSPRAMVMISLILQEQADLSELFIGEKHCPNELTAGEAKAVVQLQGQDIDHADMPDHVRLECPEHLFSLLQQRFGDRTEAEFQAMLRSASLTLRVNTLKSTQEKAQERLEAEGIKTQKCRYSKAGLQVEGKIFLSASKAFQKGHFDIQDEGSQLIAWLCDPAPGRQILDYCAGTGGKTLALSAAMENAGRVVAMDIDERRLMKSKQRLRRADIHNVELRPLSDEKHRKWMRRQKESFDTVLVDAPCSGAGTWRRNPDMRWRVYGPSLDELIGIQAEILEKVHKLVKPGGRLVYATCSILPQENEEQIEKFIADHPEFSILPLSEAAPQHLFADIPECDGDMMALTPGAHNTDGFFCAVLIRS